MNADTILTMKEKINLKDNSEWASDWDLLPPNDGICRMCLECCFCRTNNPNCECPDNPGECGDNTHYERKY